MALQKVKQLRDGTSGDYWRIVTELYCRCSNRITWQIALFKDQACSGAGKDHVGLVKSFMFPITKPQAAGDTIALGYVWIKQRANELISNDITGAPIDPRPFDLDLFDAVDV